MKTKLIIVLIAVAALGATIFPCSTQAGTTNTFTDFKDFVNEITPEVVASGQQADQQRLTRFLTELSQSLNGIVHDKGEILNNLKQSPIPRDALKPVNDDIEKKLRLASAQLHTLATLLSDGFPVKGKALSGRANRLVTELSTTLNVRESWVGKMRIILINNLPDSDLTGLQPNIEETTVELEHANSALDRLIKRLSAPQ